MGLNAGVRKAPAVATCPGCGQRHAAGTTCYEGREAAWAIVKDRDVRKEFPAIYRWARGYLGLEEPSEPSA